ncbi:MAG: hypothetical protein ACOC56_06890 [Atribacterota bacterium]
MKCKFKVGDIVKVKDNYFEEFCCNKPFDNISFSPYAKILKVDFDKFYKSYVVSGKRIFFKKENKEKYKVLHFDDDSFDFAYFDQKMFEHAPDAILRRWTNFS